MMSLVSIFIWIAGEISFFILFLFLKQWAKWLNSSRHTFVHMWEKKKLKFAWSINLKKTQT